MSERERRPHGTVVGLSGGQARIVEDELQAIARLDFVEGSRTDTRINARVDFVVITRRSPHRFWVSALKCLSRERVVYCDGGTCSVCEAVRRLAQRAAPGSN